MPSIEGFFIAKNFLKTDRSFERFFIGGQMQIQDGNIVLPLRKWQSYFASHLLFCLNHKSGLVIDCIADIKFYWPIIDSTHRDHIQQNVMAHLELLDDGAIDTFDLAWQDLAGWIIKNRDNPEAKSHLPKPLMLPVVDYKKWS